MLIATVADSHFDHRPNGRLDECIEIHDWITQDMRARGVELLLHNGDVNEGSTTPEERIAVARWFQSVAETMPAVVVRGNHDKMASLSLLGRLASRHRIHVVEDARVIEITRTHSDEPLPGGSIVEETVAVIGCLAWPRRAGILKLAAERGWGHEGAEAIAGDALRSVLRGLGQKMAAYDCPKIGLAHAMVRGSKTSTGQPLVGQPMEVGVDDLRLMGADFYALGHVHRGQCFGEMNGGWLPAGDIVYAGSPRRTAFGETEDKGYVLYDTDTKKWERVPTPCAQMHLLEARWAQSPYATTSGVPAWVWEEVSGFEGVYKSAAPRTTTIVDDFAVAALLPLDGADIRFRYEVDSDRKMEAAASANAFGRHFMERGARTFKPEPVVRSSVKAKAPQVAAERTVRGKLTAWWETKLDSPAAERQPRLLSKLAELEEEQHAAM